MEAVGTDSKSKRKVDTVTKMMDSISKRQKLLVKIKKSEVDRISNLPSSVIGHILSFLPTKYAVATSVLSTKWKYLWISISSLDLDDELVSKHVQEDNSVPSMIWSFVNFVYRVMLHNISDMRKYRLKCSQIYDVSHLNAWVSTALLRNVRELDLIITMEGHIVLPHDLFTSNSLVALKLGNLRFKYSWQARKRGTRFILNVPTVVCLSSLKILHLTKIEFLDDDSTKRLFSGCPLLEDLAIIGCQWKNISVFNISAPALKSLIIECFNGFDTNNCKYKIELNTPNLQHLKYSDLVAEGYSVKSANSLVKAYIDIGLFSESYPTLDSIRDSSTEPLAAAELFDGISNVEWLYLSNNSMEAFELFFLPKFHHLTYLELGSSYEYGRWDLLPNLLESSPQLKTLVFEELHIMGRDEDHPKHWYSPQSVPTCLLFHLKVIEIKWFGGERDEFKMVKYFLKNAKVLKKLAIQTHRYGMLKLCKKLLMLPRGSKTCQVAVS